MYGEFQVNLDVISLGPFPFALLDIMSGSGFGIFNQSPLIRFDVLNQTWNLRDQFNNSLVGPVDISSWWALDLSATVKWRIEVIRYKLKAKVWDGSGSEPGAWDYDDFRPMNDGGVPSQYPYGDNINLSLKEHDAHTLGIVQQMNNVTSTDGFHVHHDNIKVAHDSEGSEGDTSFLIEKPEGIEVGRITLPVGCQQLIYWGTRDWTTLDPFNNAIVEFSAKGWKNPSSAKLQRAESLWWYFRSKHAGGPIDLSKIRFRSFQRGDLN